MLKSIRARLTYANVLSTGCLCVLLGGVGYAAIPDSGGVFNACYDNGTGALRLVDNPACAGGETGVSWNHAGPAGAAGPSTIYVESGPNVRISEGRPETDRWQRTIVARNVPAGSYAIYASFQTGPEGSGVAPRIYFYWTEHCILIGPGNRGIVRLHNEWDHEVGERAVFLQGWVRNTVAGRIAVRCDGYGTNGMFFSHPRLTAIRVQSIDNG